MSTLAAIGIIGGILTIAETIVYWRGKKHATKFPGKKQDPNDDINWDISDEWETSEREKRSEQARQEREITERQNKNLFL